MKKLWLVIAISLALGKGQHYQKVGTVEYIDNRIVGVEVEGEIFEFIGYAELGEDLLLTFDKCETKMIYDDIIIYAESVE